MSEQSAYMGWKLDFTQPHGEPAFIAPDSVTWRISKNPVTGAIGGICAVLLEFAEPRIRSGVWDHSTFKVDPLGRAKRTGYAAAIGTYGPASAAQSVISGINKMHARVAGTTPDGTEYSALDPELIDWVGATAKFGFITAYDRFAARLSQADKDRYFEEGTEVSKLYGVQRRPESVDDFYSMMMQLEMHFEPHAINIEFLKIVESSAQDQQLPKKLGHYFACAAVDILPPIVRERLELGPDYDLSRTGRIVIKAMAKLADTIPNLKSPAAQSCERLGLPRNFLWLSQDKQNKLLGELKPSGVLNAAVDASAE